MMDVFSPSSFETQRVAGGKCFLGGGGGGWK